MTFFQFKIRSNQHFACAIAQADNQLAVCLRPSSLTVVCFVYLVRQPVQQTSSVVEIFVVSPPSYDDICTGNASSHTTPTTISCSGCSQQHIVNHTSTTATLPSYQLWATYVQRDNNGSSFGASFVDDRFTGSQCYNYGDFVGNHGSDFRYDEPPICAVPPPPSYEDYVASAAEAEKVTI